MSQHEDYRELARDIETRARRHDGMCRDVLLSVADAYEALVRHQQVFESWQRPRGIELDR